MCHTFEQHGDEYLAINPDGQIASLIHDGQVITKSTVINENLEDQFPGPPLRPKDVFSRARMRQWSKLVDESLFPAASMIGWQRRVRIIVQALGEDELGQMLARVPHREKRDKWAAAAHPDGFSDEELAGSRQRIGGFAARMETGLKEAGPWLAGADYSLTDINTLPWLHLLVPGILDEATTPHLLDWLSRIQARGTVQKTYAVSDEAPAHKHETVVRARLGG